MRLMINYLIIGIGGFLGAVARYAIGVWIGQKWGRSFLLGTFVINVSGSFFIGLLMALFTERFMVNPQWRLLLVVGYLGAYTTFSLLTWVYPPFLFVPVQNNGEYTLSFCHFKILYRRFYATEVI